MKIVQKVLAGKSSLKSDTETFLPDADLVLAFGSGEPITSKELFHLVRREHPDAETVFCSTAGEIIGDEVLDDSLVCTAIKFDNTDIKTATATVVNPDESEIAGKIIANSLPSKGLKHVLIFADGMKANGSVLTKSLRENFPGNVTITGGLAGDKGRFKHTYVGLNASPIDGLIVAVGLYGDSIKIGHGSVGGWGPFGPERLITRSKGNVLYELDGKNALELYKKYLGDHAKDLPASALLFPLSIRVGNGGGKEGEGILVRTILTINEEKQSMVFAGDVPEGSYARLMRANFDNLVDGAGQSASASLLPLGGSSPEFALLISCLGRKMTLKQRTEDEVDSVREILGRDTAVTGFYSYGEISPLVGSGGCELHNQTMTITSFSEK